MTDIFANFIKILADDGYEAYQYLRDHWWQFDFDEISEIAIEVLRAIYTCTDGDDEQRCYKAIYLELLDRHIGAIDLPV